MWMSVFIWVEIKDRCFKRFTGMRQNKVSSFAAVNPHYIVCTIFVFMWCRDHHHLWMGASQMLRLFVAACLAFDAFKRLADWYKYLFPLISLTKNYGWRRWRQDYLSLLRDLCAMDAELRWRNFCLLVFHAVFYCYRLLRSCEGPIAFKVKASQSTAHSSQLQHTAAKSILVL